jgi:hypothetical protein
LLSLENQIFNSMSYDDNWNQDSVSLNAISIIKESSPHDSEQYTDLNKSNLSQIIIENSRCDDKIPSLDKEIYVVSNINNTDHIDNDSRRKRPEKSNSKDNFLSKHREEINMLKSENSSLKTQLEWATNKTQPCFPLGA